MILLMSIINVNLDFNEFQIASLPPTTTTTPTPSFSALIALFPRDSKSEPAHRNPLVQTHLQHPILLCILYSHMPTTSNMTNASSAKNGPSLPVSWSCAELFCNKMEHVWITTKKVCILFALIWLIFYFPFQVHCVQEEDCIRIVPHPHRGQGDIVKLDKKNPSDVLVHLQLPTRHIFYIFALTVHVYPPCLPLLQQTTTSHLPVPT